MRLLVIVFILLATRVSADNAALNLTIPGLPQNFQTDRFRAGELDCQNAIGSATQLELGVTGILDQGSVFGSGEQGDVGVYGRIIIPLGKVPRSRIDCNRLYELELKRKQLEILKLEQELQQLRELQFENQ